MPKALQTRKDAARSVNINRSAEKQKRSMQLLEVAKQIKDLNKEELSEKEFREKICAVLLEIISRLK